MSKKIPGLIRIKDLGEVIATLIAVYSECPKLVKAFPDERKRRMAAEANLWLYGTYSMRRGAAYAISEPCQGAVIVLPSKKKKASKVGYLLTGSYSRPYKRLLAELTEEERETRDKVFEETENMESEINFPKKYLYISFFGVKSQYRRQGIGKKLMEKVVAEGARKSLPVVLYTSEPKSVAFYQELGFKVMGITSSKQFEFINIYLVRG